LSDILIGLDLGQSQDFTAVALVEKVGDEYRLRALDRVRHMPYPEIIERVSNMMNRIKHHFKMLVIDATGCGSPIVDVFRQQISPVIGITVTGGLKPSFEDGKAISKFAGSRYQQIDLNVPKRDLVSNLVMLSQLGRLKVAPNLEHAPVLRKEIENFKIKINIKTGHDSYEAWREGDHDDLLFAAALACYWGEYMGFVGLPSYKSHLVMSPNLPLSERGRRLGRGSKFLTSIHTGDEFITW
jgi:hypothetical protein